MKTFKRRKYGSEIWKIIAKFGCPPKFIAEFSEPFEVTNGVKQVCVMAPTLFSMMFSAMLMDTCTFQDSDTDFLIRYRFDGNIFNPRRLQAKTKVPCGLAMLDECLISNFQRKSSIEN